MREKYDIEPSSFNESLQAISGNICNRCQGDTLINDIYGRKICPDCHSVEGKTLYRFHRKIDIRMHILKFPFKLSQAQRKGSDFIKKLIINKQNGIMHAICGAGKTEMTYDGIIYALNHEMKICFAIPRKEIVIELEKRFKAYFPSTIIKALHQDNKDDERAHLVISTIHQLINYYHEFDLVILDEADAYPYAGNKYLSRLVQKAICTKGILIQMSATFDKNEIDIRKTSYHLLPARFHNHNLDEPQFVQVENIQTMIKTQKIPHTIKLILDRWIKSNLSVFLFVPSIRIGCQLTKIFKQYGYLADNISSESTDKAYRLEKFKRRQTEILFTTTILERGVTFKNVQVGVMFSDNHVFTKSVLIQICGRVGRFKEFPSGEICFFSEYKTRSMIEAKKEIRSLNRLKRDMK